METLTHDDQFWIVPAFITQFPEDSPGRYVEVVEPSWLSGAIAEPGPVDVTRCQAQHPSERVACPLIDGHDGPHWKASMSMIDRLWAPIRIVIGEPYPAAWIMCEPSRYSPLFRSERHPA